MESTFPMQLTDWLLIGVALLLIIGLIKISLVKKLGLFLTV
jgi:Sec-independent protein translocase protein TatA